MSTISFIAGVVVGVYIGQTYNVPKINKVINEIKKKIKDMEK
jgi:hypothetical protein